MPPASDSPIPAALWAHWPAFRAARVAPITSGLINRTLCLETAAGDKAILQRLHPVFSPEVNLNIQAVTAHLAARGLPTPRLLPTDQGDLWVTAEDGVWRALTWMPGSAPQRLTDPAQAREAGRLVGRFHAALMDLEHHYRGRRGQVHDTPAHLARLRQALEEQAEHRLRGPVAALGEPLLRAAEDLVDLERLPARHAHGDLKISNLMFDAAGRGLCLIDLDTLAPMAWPLEMGDALRSWCNPHQEDQPQPRLDLDLFAAAVSGYQEVAGDLITREEWAALVPGLARICLELAARFLADALHESYFGWDPARYPARGEHNLARGRAMWALYRDVMARQGEAQGILQRLW